MFKFEEICELIRLVGSSEVASGRDRARWRAAADRRQGAGVAGPVAQVTMAAPLAVQHRRMPVATTAADRSPPDAAGRRPR